MPRRIVSKLWMLALPLALSGCVIDAPVDPGRLGDALFGGIGDLLTGLQNQVEDFVEDPLDTKPFPVLLGGNSQRLLYATNLGDIKINFPGPTNDLVIPGLLGPSNLYLFEDRKRSLLRPFIPAGAFTSLASDGRHVAYIAVTRLEEPVRVTVQAGFASALAPADRVLFDSDSDDALLIPGTLALDQGRAVFAVVDPTTQQESIRIVDIFDTTATRIIETGPVGRVELRGDLLLYVESIDAGIARIVLQNLLTDEEAVVADAVRIGDPTAAYLTNNTVVYQSGAGGVDPRVLQFDLVTGETRVLADAVAGRLSGASDTYFLVEERYVGDNGNSERISIRRFDLEGESKELADFRADGLAGQSRVIGDRAVWVNKSRQIILAPLAGGERTSIQPF